MSSVPSGLPITSPEIVDAEKRYQSLETEKRLYDTILPLV
jgi:hypothetical protein